MRMILIPLSHSRYPAYFLFSFFLLYAEYSAGLFLHTFSVFSHPCFHACVLSVYVGERKWQKFTSSKPRSLYCVVKKLFCSQRNGNDLFIVQMCFINGTELPIDIDTE